ncbi:MAG: hypothetical protein AAF491_09880, partial [Verrucomicrobiota bacterium]
MSLIAANPLESQAASPAPESGGSVTAGFGTSLDGFMSLEGTAVQFGLLPVSLPRETCTVEAETILRRLGRFPSTDTPWLPIATIGPSLIFAHYAPKSADMWGVPSCFAVRVAISQEQYDKIRKDLVMRLSNAPLPQQNSLEQLSVPSFSSGDLESAFQWLLEHYPYDETERERLTMLYAEAVDKSGTLEKEDYNSIQSSLGVALQYLTQGPSLLCFNPEEAPKQERFPSPLLEKHNVYPLYEGDHKIYLLSASESNFSFEDEWLS